VLIERKETAHIRSNKVSHSKRSDSKKSTKILKLHQGICQHWFSYSIVIIIIGLWFAYLLLTPIIVGLQQCLSSINAIPFHDEIMLHYRQHDEKRSCKINSTKFGIYRNTINNLS
jgi:hypothetical protein